MLPASVRDLRHTRGRSPASRRGAVLLILVAVMGGCLLLAAMVTSTQSNATGRALARATMGRHSLEAGESAFNEALADMRGSFARAGPGAVSNTNWHDLLLNLQSPLPSKGAPMGTMTPRITRTVYEDPAFGYQLGDVEVAVIQSHDLGDQDPRTTPVRTHGVFELRLSLTARQGPLTSRKRILQRFQYYITYRTTVVDPTTLVRAPYPPLTAGNCDVVLLNGPLGLSYQDVKGP